MKDILVALSIIAIAAPVEAFGLFYLRAGGVFNIIKASIIYGVVVVPLLAWAVKYEGIGIANFMWNVLSTLLGFFIGIYLYKEKVRNLQLIGVLISFLGLGLIIIDPETH
jgi:multidrug transporter EmrE-like cation transporter